MGYTEVWTICEGAIDEELIVEDGPQALAQLNEWLESVEKDAKQQQVKIEVHTLYHGHDMDEEECACSQYERSHLPDFTFGPDEPEEDDIVTEDYKSFWQGGHEIFEVKEDEDWKKICYEWMNSSEYWPNVWFISDHGNLSLVTAEVMAWGQGDTEVDTFN